MELIQRVLIVGSLNSVDYLIDHKLIIRIDELLTSVFLNLWIHELLKYKLQIFYKFEINTPKNEGVLGFIYYNFVYVQKMVFFFT